MKLESDSNQNKPSADKEIATVSVPLEQDVGVFQTTTFDVAYTVAVLSV